MKTLFVLAKIGIRKGKNLPDTLESWMWNLSEEQKQAEFISIHKTKSDAAWKGGRIVGYRMATDEEVGEHQDAMYQEGKEPMKRTDARFIIEFEPDRSIVKRKYWPKVGQSNPMTYLYLSSGLD